VELRGLPTKDALPPDTLRVLVVGDSVAKFLGLAMRYRQDEKQSFVAERGVGDCSIFESKPYIENGKQLMSSSCSSKWATDVAELRPDVTLIVMGGAFFNPDTCTKNFQIDYEKRVLELVQSMGPMAGQIVITRVPYPVKDWRHSNVIERVDCFNQMLVRIAEKGKFDILDLMQHVCPTPACIMESEGKPIRPDGLHFDGGGTEETARWVLGELARMHKRLPNE
jgi:lysophospholipase L1-like esterase